MRKLILFFTLFGLAASFAYADVIADSINEFSGAQGQDGWEYGYRDYTADGGEEDSYDPNDDFIPFAGGENDGDWDGVDQLWTGGAWDLETAAQAPWTFMGNEGIHPNSENNGGEHWAIRRWVAEEVVSPIAVAIEWHVRATNVNGSGTTGSLFQNGELIDTIAIEGNDDVGSTRTYYINLEPEDVIDLALTPVGPGGDRADGADGSATWMVIDDFVPGNATQPDGTPFIPGNGDDEDEDGLIDGWEEIYFPGDLAAMTGNGDNDGDGVDNTEEFEEGTNPTLTDSDGDGLDDRTEIDGATDPTNADSDGDGLSDGDEVNGTPPTSPTDPDSDGDTYSDGEEIAAGSNPADAGDTPLSGLIADSVAEFSGFQEQDNWEYGYRNLTADGGGDEAYAPEDLILFGEEFWTGGHWDLGANAPWTEIRPETGHPNGTNNANEHWAIRRWTSEVTEVTPLALWWHVRKTNTNGGDGVSGGVYLNGQRLDFATIGGTDGTGVERRVYANIGPGDVVDLVLTPQGINGRADGSDGSAFWLRVDTRLPDEPRQPDGSLFVSATADDSDADGLPDPWELSFFPGDLTKLSGAADLDEDGSTDAEEFEDGTDPNDSDSDDDGLLDGVETGTNVFVSANDTGTNPKVADTDGDTLDDGDEVTGDVPSNPNLADSDTDCFTDAEEIAAGFDPLDPNSNAWATLIANSTKEFSGVQGQDGWNYGYRALDPFTDDIDYDPQDDFIAFTGGDGEGAWDGVDQQWTGSWDLETAGQAPWTFMSAETVHPNGDNSGEFHYVIRRWVADELNSTTPLAVHWHVRKQNVNCGNGVTGAIHVNGVRVDSLAIEGNDGVGEERTYYVNVEPGDAIDLINSSEGPDGGFADGCDGSWMWMRIDTAIPPNATQPDGTPFVPSTGVGFQITTVDVDGAGDVTLTWPARSNRLYSVETSVDLIEWTEQDDGLEGDEDGIGTFVDEGGATGGGETYYRIVELDSE